MLNKNTEYALITGDYNITLDPKLDSQNYTTLNNPRARNVLLQMIQTQSLIDIYRHTHPDTKRYTWRQRNPIKQARLDYFLILDTLIDLVSNTSVITP